jgi:AraC family transcriptional regulator
MAAAKALELDYHYRINHVVNYIEEHLTNPLTLEEVSEVGAFSPYHFHRVFKTVMGENVHAFVQRIRVEKAIKLLLFHPYRSVSDIALDCGLQTAAHFCRVFRQHTGLSATEFRRRHDLRAISERFRAGLPLEKSDGLVRRLAEIPIELRNLAPMQAIYARYRGTINEGKENPNIPALFSRVSSWLEAREALNEDSMTVGLVLDDPFITPEGKHRYDACLTTEQPLAPTGDLGVRTIPGGKYAIVRMADSPDMVKAVLHLISIEWLASSPYIWDISRPALEIYFPDSPHHPEGIREMEFGIPVKLDGEGFS